MASTYYVAHPRQSLNNQWQINDSTTSHVASGPNALVQYIYENIGGSYSALGVNASTNTHYYVYQSPGGLWIIHAMV